MMWLAAGTLASEDLTCVAAGALVADGRLGFGEATLACFAGILAGDLLLFLLGRSAGRWVLASRLAARLVRPAAINRGSEWLGRHGLLAILATRFVPGTRVPTYVAAGALKTSAWRFAGFLALAAACWTPLLVGASALVGKEAAEEGLGFLPRMVLVIAVAAGTLAALRAALTWRVRRRLFGAWCRLTRWEFWPPWLLYPPVAAYMAWLAIEHRSLTVFTAANPGIPGGGFVGESKIDILHEVARHTDNVARAGLLRGNLTAAERMAAADRFMREGALAFPVILKPNQGQRGSGVVIVRTRQELELRLAAAPIDLILQEYAPGAEFGVFYYRRPSEAHGHIFSVTEKRFPAVTGDGTSTLEELILADPRAVCLEHVHRTVHHARLETIPPAGETIRLVEIGSHCRGSLFVDATPLATPALAAAFDGIAGRCRGFHFGRFDVRTPSVEDFLSGRNFRIVELNGVTSEATHIYDPSHGLLAAYRVLFAQWRLAFEIGAENRRRGATGSRVSELVGFVRDYRRVARLHPRENTA